VGTLVVDDVRGLSPAEAAAGALAGVEAGTLAGVGAP
jgi:hypothetical protein